MADREDAHREACLVKLSAIYTLMVHACAALPVPITLPTEDLHHGTVIPAVRRTLAILTDVPVGEDTKAYLGSGCIAFLAASDLYGLLMVEYDPARVAAIDGLLMQAEDSLALAYRLLTED